MEVVERGESVTLDFPIFLSEGPGGHEQFLQDGIYIHRLTSFALGRHHINYYEPKYLFLPDRGLTN